jgi:hypothetical protein
MEILFRNYGWNRQKYEYFWPPKMNIQSFNDLKTLHMKKAVGILLIMLTFGASVPMNGQQIPKDRKIKSVVVYQEKYDMLVTRKYKDSEQYFDQRGNLIEDITYKQGKVNKHFKYQYDSDNNKIREEELDPSGRTKEVSEYKYENGLRREKIVYDSNKKIKSKRIYQYTTYQ